MKGVSIPKKLGGERLLGVPTVSDRVAQTVVKMEIEPTLETVFDDNSFDNIDHTLLMKAVRHHIQCKWAILYMCPSGKF